MKENPRATKVSEFKAKLDGAQVAIIADYKGVTVKEMESFRRELRASGSELKIIKNTLAKRALAEAEYPAVDEILKGQIAFVLGFSDAVAGPKATKGFARKHKNFKVIGGIYAGTRISPETVMELASMPTKDELRGRLLMLMQGPQRKFLGLLSAVPQELVGTLDALIKLREESSPAETAESSPAEPTESNPSETTEGAV